MGRQIKRDDNSKLHPHDVISSDFEWLEPFMVFFVEENIGCPTKFSTLIL